MRVLIVDDDDLVRTSLVRMLEPRHSTCWAATADGAIRLLVTERDIGCVLLDINLGERQLNGFDVARFIHSDPHLRHIPIVVVSGLPAGDIREGARSDALAGVSFFVEKPVDFSILDRILSGIVGSKEIPSAPPTNPGRGRKKVPE